MLISIAALTAFFWEMNILGICASDLLGAAEDGFFDSDAEDFVVRFCVVVFLFSVCFVRV